MRPRPNPPPKNPPVLPTLFGRNTLAFGEVMERLIAEPPPGDRLVDGGALNVLEPRLPKEPPKPARAKPSPAMPSAKTAARPRMSDL